jgi:hypothetical protein
MKFVQLETSNGQSLWVNPGSVAVVEQAGQGSDIFFAAIAGEDTVLLRHVALSPSEVAEQLNGGLRG